ncbi:hypothetical protein [Oceanicaulis alexandrii]|uniref:hypothetical protein n=1 Tax=Oceanicaulis alexandrii TaxID=153233 RepID=UPI003B506727|tara:strand:- start:850 stop:1314 length:465 start_codon:yes stop_codon:yes gene_type:complete
MSNSNLDRHQDINDVDASSALAEWLNENLNERSGLANDEIATELGYKRANICAMWKTGKAPIPLHALKRIAQLTNTPLERLFPMWVEQYAQEKRMKAKPYREMLSRIVTPAEYKLVEAVRGGGLTCEHLTDDEKHILSLMLIGPTRRAELFRED